MEWLKQLFCFHYWSSAIMHKETAGLGSHVYFSQFCKKCGKVTYTGRE